MKPQAQEGQAKRCNECKSQAQKGANCCDEYLTPCLQTFRFGALQPLLQTLLLLAYLRKHLFNLGALFFPSGNFAALPIA
jgi:hypothetical protein